MPGDGTNKICTKQVLSIQRAQFNFNLGDVETRTKMNTTALTPTQFSSLVLLTTAGYESQWWNKKSKDVKSRLITL